MKRRFDYILPLLLGAACGFSSSAHAWVGFHGGGFGAGSGSMHFGQDGSASWHDGSGSASYRDGSANWDNGSGSATYKGGSANWDNGSGSAAYKGGSANWDNGSGSATYKGNSASWDNGSGTVDRSGGDSASWNRNSVTVDNPSGRQTTYDRNTYYGGVYGGGGYHGAPVAVYGGGYGCCYGCCGGGAALAAGMTGVAVGAMAESAATRPAVVENNYVEVPVGTVPAAVPIGGVVSALPAGCMGTMVGGSQYYQCGSTWFSPYFGSSGVAYRAVLAP